MGASDRIPQKPSFISTDSTSVCTTHFVSECISLAASNRSSAWLIYDTWPSWLYALPHYDIVFARIFTTLENLVANQTLHREFSQADCQPLSVLVDVEGGALPFVILAQGSLSLWSLPFFNVWQHSTVLFSPDTSYFIVPTSLPPGWQSFSLSHSECGGVLDGSYAILCGHGTVRQPLSTSTVRRCLKHAINPSTPGWDTTPVSRHAPLDATGHLPHRTLAHAVRCPTVFPRRPVMVRPLSLSELARALNLPASVTLQTTDHPSSIAAPAKVLFHAFHSCVLQGGGMDFFRVATLVVQSS